MPTRGCSINICVQKKEGGRARSPRAEIHLVRTLWATAGYDTSAAALADCDSVVGAPSIDQDELCWHSASMDRIDRRSKRVGFVECRNNDRDKRRRSNQLSSCLHRDVSSGGLDLLHETTEAVFIYRLIASFA